MKKTLLTLTAAASLMVAGNSKAGGLEIGLGLANLALQAVQAAHQPQVVVVQRTVVVHERRTVVHHETHKTENAPLTSAPMDVHHSSSY